MPRGVPKRVALAMKQSKVLRLINISLFVSVLYLIVHKVLYSINHNIVTKMGNYLLVLTLLLMLFAGAANLYGSVLLSSLLIDAVLTSLYASMVFYALYIILTGYVVIILRRRISTASNMLEKF